MLEGKVSVYADKTIDDPYRFTWYQDNLFQYVRTELSRQVMKNFSKIRRKIQLINKAFYSVLIILKTKSIHSSAKP